MLVRLSLLALCCWLLCPVPVGAQASPEWPRHPISGNIQFSGLLPWPVAGATPAQQRARARHWYAANLTSEKSTRPATSDTTFAGLPDWAYLDSVSYPSAVPRGEDSVYYRVIWRLLYKVNLTPTPAGLTYHLSEFECAEIVFDASSSERLEVVLGRYASQMAVFHRRLRKALARW
jgi:hypothetical protein